jgi:endonuclease/exonuclease/phosphatase (EEP) superfamily protein YafD
MIVATLLPLLKKDNWWIRSFDFPRLQIAIINGAVFIAYLPYVTDTRLADKLFFAALFLCLLYQCYMMLPYTPFTKKQVQKSQNATNDSSFSLLFANVLMENRNSEQLKKIITDTNPDIILTAEINEWWQKELEELTEIYPHTIQYPQDNCYGMALFSKFELINPEVKFLVENDIPSIHTQVRISTGKLIDLHCLHPEPPFLTGDEKSTDRDAELLIVGREIKDSTTPAIVFGDLNDVAWSRTNYLFQNISGLLDPRIGRGFYNTFHAKYPFLRFPLDHAFHSKHFRLIDFKRLPFFGSDHFPVYLELSYEPDAEDEQQELHADESEQQEADEKIRETA